MNTIALCRPEPKTAYQAFDRLGVMSGRGRRWARVARMFSI